MEAADASTRRECQRAVVEQVALTLFLREGFDKVTVEQIAAEAGVAPATFYRYFGTKHGVLFAYQDEFVSAVRTAARGTASKDRTRALTAALYCFADLLERSADRLALRDEVVLRNPALMPQTIAVQRQWEDELAAGLAASRGLDEPDLAARLDAAVGLVLTRVAFRRWRDDHAGTLRERLTDVLEEADACLPIASLLDPSLPRQDVAER